MPTTRTKRRIKIKTKTNKIIITMIQISANVAAIVAVMVENMEANTVVVEAEIVVDFNPKKLMIASHAPFI